MGNSPDDQCSNIDLYIRPDVSTPVETEVLQFFLRCLEVIKGEMAVSEEPM
jgi:hypothetical protein